MVPLFGDMQIMPFAFVKKCPNYDAAKWPCASVETTVCPINIVERLKIIREQHTEYVTHLSRIHNEVIFHLRSF